MSIGTGQGQAQLPGLGVGSAMNVQKTGRSKYLMWIGPGPMTRHE